MFSTTKIKDGEQKRWRIMLFLVN